MEASLAPEQGDLLSLPFDQYGRMRITQNVLHLLYSEIGRHVHTEEGVTFKLRVLDVGGYPGILPLFLGEEFYETSVLDVVPDNGSIPSYTQGSGLDLPFSEGSFDVVTALDTLEHIPAADRERFLGEIMRVAKYGALLINPIQSTEADLAEEMLNEYIRWLLDAQQEQLAEHRTYGLPNFGSTQATLQAGGWRTLPFTVANVYNWLLMMIAKHYLISMRSEQATAFERTLDRFYNLTFSDGDRTEPAYRGVLVAVKPEMDAVLETIRLKYPPLPQSDGANTERLQLTQVLMTMLDLKVANHEDRLLREQMEARDRNIAQLEQRVASMDIQLNYRTAELAELQGQSEYLTRLEGDLRAKDEHIRYLEQLLEKIEAGRVMRLTRSISRFLGRH